MSDTAELSAPMPDEESAGTARRVFLKTGLVAVGATYVGAVLYPVYRYLSTPAREAAALAAVKNVELKGADTLPAGTALMFRFGTRPAMLIHHTDGQWVCFDAICTHLGCTVRFDAPNRRIFCACHGGTYDSYTGKNIAGPPPKPLRAYKVEVQHGAVLVSRA